jgi:hypothetical protein
MGLTTLPTSDNNSDVTTLNPRLFAPPLRGEQYLRFLERLHAALKPTRYLEIGVQAGHSLKIAKCSSIGVDPIIGIDNEALSGKPELFLFQKTSDRFFAEHNPVALLGGPVDLAFLDGLHLFEVLLRDFINAENVCRRNSVIVLHDCVPTDAGMTRRVQGSKVELPTRARGNWTGDVWKIVPLLRKHRPDLQIHVLDARPTGLVLITNLDPASNVLRESYFEIVASYRDLDLAEIGLTSFHDSLNVRSTNEFNTPEKLLQYFWL